MINFSRLKPLLFIITTINTVFLIGCSKHNSEDLAELRNEALKQEARAYGAQTSLALHAKNINEILTKNCRYLDHIFNFSYLMLEHRVLPPVLQEGQNLLNLADDAALRIADHEYQIVAPARFVTTPPNWRDYLWMNYKVPEKLNSLFTPKNNTEAAIWKEYYAKGIEDGTTQAEQIFSVNLSHLVRDYSGMILYRKLRSKKMISAPMISKLELGVTGNATDLHLNDRILRITSSAALQTDASKWQPIIVENASNAKN